MSQFEAVTRLVLCIGFLCVGAFWAWRAIKGESLYGWDARIATIMMALSMDNLALDIIDRSGIFK